MEVFPIIPSSEFKKVSMSTLDSSLGLYYFNNHFSSISIRGEDVEILTDYRIYENLGIELKWIRNPNRFISFWNLLRYFQETNPEIISARENEIMKRLPSNLKKIITIDKFHYSSIINFELPSSQEAYQLIAKILVNRDPNHWRPTLAANNSWKNWTSGDL
jgi:hypothetical protein